MMVVICNLKIKKIYNKLNYKIQIKLVNLLEKIPAVKKY